MSVRQKLTDLTNDGINRLDEDDADELLKVLEENTRLREVEIAAGDLMSAIRKIGWVASRRYGKTRLTEAYDRLHTALAPEGEGEDGS